jgi:hypothetical protein
MGINISVEKVSACDIKYIQEKHINDYIIITTIDNTTNIPLIKGTISPHEEETVINKMIGNKKHTRGIIIYGKNNQDASVIKKYKQLIQFNIGEVYIYIGGLFEWLLLHKTYPEIFLLNNNDTKYNLWELHASPNQTILKTI